MHLSSTAQCLHWMWCLLVQGRLRKMVIEMVLATDMKQHCLILSRFQSKLQVGPVLQQDLSSLSFTQIETCPCEGFHEPLPYTLCGSMGFCTWRSVACAERQLLSPCKSVFEQLHPM